ncbi:MAG: MarR family transcriptional regulator [Oscillospiraceae bacterium]|nr:MarR family transcriptional regulator [Oscillospiraceae bacterium]
MNTVLEYINETLHMEAEISEYDKANELPLYLRAGNNLYALSIQNAKCLLVRPKEKANLTDLRKQAARLKKLTGLESVLYLDSARVYTREKMLSEGIPFIIAGKQIYMPFLGVALTKNDSRDIPQVDAISFTTQKLLLMAIYQKWAEMTVTEAASVLGVSKMSVTRCFDELQAFDLNLIITKGKTRCFAWTDHRRALWDITLPYLRNPVYRQYRFGLPIELRDCRLGGISALCHYSMLADNPCTTYGVRKDIAKALELSKLEVIPPDESPVMVVQVMRYNIDYLGNEAVDPLTAILSLSGSIKDDPRIEAAIEKVLEDCLND